MTPSPVKPVAHVQVYEPYMEKNKKVTIIIVVLSKFGHSVPPGAIIGDGDRKSRDSRAPIIWDNFSIFRTNCPILRSYIRADSRTCQGLSRGCCHVA